MLWHPVSVPGALRGSHPRGTVLSISFYDVFPFQRLCAVSSYHEEAYNESISAASNREQTLLVVFSSWSVTTKLDLFDIAFIFWDLAQIGDSYSRNAIAGEALWTYFTPPSLHVKVHEGSWRGYILLLYFLIVVVVNCLIKNLNFHWNILNLFL